MLRGISKDRTSEYPLSGYKDLKREQTLSDGSELLSFYIPKKYATNIEFESYVQTENQEYVVKELNPDGDFYEVVTKLNLEKFWGKMWKNFENVEATITDTLNLALAGTGWIVGTCEITKKRTIRKTNSSTLDIINQCLKTYLAEIEYDTLNKVINIYATRGTDKGKFAMDTVNAKKITLQASSYEYITKLICIGATTTTKDSDDNETSTTLEVTVTNNTYSSKDIAAIWKDERYTVEADLIEDGQAKLDELAKPVEAYSVDFAFLDDVNIGDTITLISKENNIFKKLRVVKLTTYPDDPEKAPTGELGSRIYSFEDMQKQYEDTTSTVSNITADDGSISSSALKDAFNKLVLAELDVATLNALDARIGQLEVTYVTATELVAERANIKNAVIEQLNADDIYAKRAEINVLSSNVANINTLLAGTVTTGSTQTIVLNSQNTTIENALIKSAMIDSLDVSKINSGVISTNKFTIQSNDGGITIADNTMQFKDNNDNVRIQMGQDTSGNFSFIIVAEDGTTTLIDGTGVKENAIADKLIKTSMINDKAITKDKIDYTSFVEGYNADTNINTIKASKVLLDGTRQTLDVKFNTLQTTVNDLSVGGVNIIENGGFTKNLEGWTNNLSKATLTIIDESSAISGKALKIQSTATSQGVYRSVSSKTGTLTVSFYAKKDSDNPTTLWAGIEGANTKNIELTTSYKRYIIVCKSSSFRSLVFYNNSAGISYIHSIKVEEGNMATDWSYCPNEIDKRITTNSTSISAIQGQISTLISQTSQITTNANNITTLTSNYSSLTQTVNSLNTTVSSHTTSISNLNTTVSDHTSSITQLNNSITTKVWSSDITASINALQIGGENLVINGGFDYSSLYWNTNQVLSTSIIDESTSKSGKALKLSPTSAGNGIFQRGINCTKDYLTMTIWAKADVTMNIYFGLEGYSQKTVSLTTSWKKFTLTVNCGVITNKTVIIYPSSAGTFYLHSIKVEEGQKSTDWCPSSKEISTRLNNADTKISSVEQQITSTAITTKISTGLSGTDSISNTYFTMDNKGLTIKNGGIKILNNANTEVLACDTNGDLTLRGTFTNYSADTGYLACKIENTQIKFYNFKENNEQIGSLGTTVSSTDVSDASITLWHEVNNSLIVGWRHAVTKTIKPYFTCEYGSLMRFKAICGFESGICVDEISFMTEITESGGYTTGTSILQQKSSSGTRFLEITDGLKVDNELTTIGNVIIGGNMTASGSKNCLQQTENFGGRLFYSLEDCSSYLTDRVDVPVQVKENKQIKIEFNDIFKECVNLTNYQITINKETYGDYRIVEKTKDYFILESDTEGFKFTYTITAKRKGYEDRYLDEFKAS